MIWDGRVRGSGRGGRVWRRPKKVNLGREWIQMEAEGKSTCEKLRAVLGGLLVVAVCQHIPLKYVIHAKIPTTGISDLRNIFGRSEISVFGMCASIVILMCILTNRYHQKDGQDHAQLFTGGFALIFRLEPFPPKMCLFLTSPNPFPRPNPRTRTSQTTRSRHLALPQARMTSLIDSASPS